MNVRELFNASLHDERYCDTGRMAGLNHDVIVVINRLIPGLLLPVKHRLIRAESRVHLYMQRACRDSYYAAIDDYGSAVTVITCYRPFPQQFLLWHWYMAGKKCGIPLAAAPGNSHHEDACATDQNPYQRLIAPMRRHGFRWLGLNDRTHFDRLAGCRDDVGHIGVKAFQIAHNEHHTAPYQLKVDGERGPKTDEALWNAPIDGWQMAG